VRAALFSSVGFPPLRPLIDAVRGWIPQGSGRTVAYIPAASTASTYISLTAAAFEGIAAVEVVGVDAEWAPDARDVERVRTADLLYVSGGNTYLLARRLHRSGLDEVVRERVLAGVPLLTFSAGTVLCGPTIVSTNDWNVVESSRFEGLGILPFHVNVHYPIGAEARAQRADRILHFLDLRREPLVALEDDAWLAIAGGAVVPRCGRAWLFTPDAEAGRELAMAQPIEL
jgi:dipeptidase E